MDRKFRLFQSGIHRSDVVFKNEGVSVSDRDTFVLADSPVDLELVRKKLERAVFDPNEFDPHEEYEGIYAAKRGSPHDFLYMDGSVRAVVVSSRESIFVLAEEGYEEFTPLKLWSKVSEAKYTVRHLGTSMVPMEDGVKLAMDVWLPEGKEKCHAILVRTPYGRAANNASYHKYVMRGYAVCIQDVRGRGDSEGEWIPKYYERDDGNDTMNFIAAQSWSTGNIGTFGGSYLGCVQWAAAARANPHHKAIVSIVTSGDPFFDLPRKGGALCSGVMAWAFSVKDRQFKKELMQRDDWDKILAMRPLKDIPKKVFGSEIPFWTKWCEHEAYDEFWERCNWFADREKIAKAQIPALIVSGWYNDNGNATSQALEIVDGYDEKNKKVILGAWMHNANSSREIHNVRFGSTAIRYDLDLLYMMWFDNKLAGIDNGIDKGMPVEYYVVGNEKWEKSHKWKPEDTVGTEIFLSDDGKLAFESGADGSAEYEFDPRSPAPHIIDISENEICVPENYSEVEKRDDVLIFTSEPFEKDVTIAGDITAEIYISSTAPDTDFVVRLTDVDERGNSIRLCDGLIRAKFRDGRAVRLLEPGKVEKLSIRTTKIANTFKKGHKMRLQITSGAENYIFPNPNTGKDFFSDSEYKTCKNTVHYGKSYPSKIFVPIKKAT